MSREVSSITFPTRQQLQEVVKSLQKQMQSDGRGLSAGVSATQLALLITTLLAAIVGCGAAVFISRRIVGNVGNLLHRAKAIASGDLTGQAIETSSHDELADLTTAVNEMQASLRSLLGSIEHNAESVASASEEISSAATQSAQGIQAQSTQAIQVATAVQEMAASVAEVSENSHRVADGARQAAETAKEGGKVVDKALEVMRAIAASVGATAGKIAELGKSSNQIGKIVAVIDEIADQTNLLALNAAIEAARAGEQGRGFAVVADEVRKLAERTTKATKEIAQMIETVQRETRTAVENMQSGTKQVELGVTTTTQAGASLAEIINAAQRVGEMVGQIATSAAQQSSATSEIKDRIESIAKITQESSSGAEQSARACQDLSGLALDLQQLVGRFQLDGRRADPVRRMPGKTREQRASQQRQPQPKSIPQKATGQASARGYQRERVTQATNFRPNASRTSDERMARR
jgi:methyl-accepting chemotaxis protein